MNEKKRKKKETKIYTHEGKFFREFSASVKQYFDKKTCKKKSRKHLRLSWSNSTNIFQKKVENSQNIFYLGGETIGGGRDLGFQFGQFPN